MHQKPREVLFQQRWVLQPRGAISDLSPMWGDGGTKGLCLVRWVEMAGGRLRGKKLTSGPLPCPRRSENMVTGLAKLMLFSSVEALLPCLVPRVEHWGEVLTFRGDYEP